MYHTVDFTLFLLTTLYDTNCVRNDSRTKPLTFLGSLSTVSVYGPKQNVINYLLSAV